MSPRTATSTASRPSATRRQATPQKRETAKQSRKPLRSASGDAAASLIRALERLWTDHAVWTRQYVVARVAGSPDDATAATRLMQNQGEIGNAIVPFYGEKAGRKLTELLQQHILIAVDLVDAAIHGDENTFKTSDEKWDQNAAEIAHFLGKANPFWPERETHDLLALHLALTRQEVVHRINKEWDKDMQVWDQILTEILTLSDTLAMGIVRQFPERFQR